MNALLYFGRKGNLPDADMKALREWKKEWAKVNPKGKSLGYYEVRMQRRGQAETRISDNALAFSGSTAMWSTRTPPGVRKGKPTESRSASGPRFLLS